MFRLDTWCPPRTELRERCQPPSWSSTTYLYRFQTMRSFKQWNQWMWMCVQNWLRKEIGTKMAKLTRWKTGRRFLYIGVPSEPLPKIVEIGPFKASFYHKEQKTEERQSKAECRKCLQKGHRAAACVNPIKCRQCFKDGHKAGDADCAMTPAASGASVDDLCLTEGSDVNDQNRTSPVSNSKAAQE